MLALIVRTVKDIVLDLQLKAFAQEIAQTHAKPHQERAFGRFRCASFTTCLGSIPLHVQEPAQEGWTLPVHPVLPLWQAKEQSSPSLSVTKGSAAFKILY